MGSEDGLHNYHWHANILRRNNRTIDQVQVRHTGSYGLFP